MDTDNNLLLSNNNNNNNNNTNNKINNETRRIIKLSLPSFKNRRRARFTQYACCFNTGSHFRGHLHIMLSFIFGFIMSFIMFTFFERRLLLCERLDYQSTIRGTGISSDPSGSMMMMMMPSSDVDDASAQDIDLINRIRILCMVLTCPEYHQTRAIHIRATWGKRCTQLIFISSETDEELNAISVVESAADVYDNLWNKTREGFRYVYEHYFEDYDWFIKADDDTYMVIDNLKYMLYGYYPETPLYFGYELKRYNVSYMSGGASYVLSKEALRRFMTKSFHNDTICPNVNRAEDFYMSICLQNVGVHLIDSRFATAIDRKAKFFPLDVASYVSPKWNETIPDWLYKMTPYSVELGIDCCSNYSIAFHYITPDLMYTYEYFIYYMQAYSIQRPQLKLPIKLSSAEVAELFPVNNTKPIVNLHSPTLPPNF